MTDSGWAYERHEWTVDESGVWTAHAADTAQMRQRGAALAAVVRAGDVLVLDGPLGAGKTTFVQGLGSALGVRGAVTSPTFVISRVHRGPRLNLVHVDAYRLAGSLELDDLDLDAEVAESVTVIEWGSGKAEELAADRLHIMISNENEDVLGVADGALPDSDRDAGEGDRAEPGGPLELVHASAEQTSADSDFIDASAGIRVIRVRGVGSRWSQLHL